jgi:hypothetical protein
MAVRRALRSAVALLAALGLVIGLPLAAAAEDTVAFTITDSRIIESSGLARDTKAESYWTVNDSGDEGVAYRISPNGKVTGTLEYRADPVDVEAVAMHDGRLYVADIGDNDADRELVTVYYFNDARAADQSVAYRSWEFRYPDGAHDAETLLVNDEGRLYIVTKGAAGAVYAAPTSPERTAVNELERVGDAPAAVTDGTFLPGGDRIALLTYFGRVEVLDAKSYRKVDELTFPAQRQPESLTVSLSGKSLLVGSEGEDSKVYAVPMPSSGSTATPTPTATSSEGGDGADEPDAQEEAEAQTNAGQGRARTFLALGLAGLVAIAAGSVVALARKP